MAVDRLKRINELLRREIADALFRIMTEEAFDLSAVTITHVQTSRNLRHARVLVSVLGHEGEHNRMLSLLRRHRTEFQARINADLVLKYTPRLSFELDTSVERGDHMLDVLAQLEKDLPSAADTPVEEPPGEANDDER